MKNEQFIEEQHPDKFIVNADSFLSSARLGAVKFNRAIELSKQGELSKVATQERRMNKAGISNVS